MGKIIKMNPAENPVKIDHNKYQNNKNIDEIAKELHNEGKFNQHFEEYISYHEKVVDEITGKAISKNKLLDKQFKNYIQDLQEDLKERVHKKDEKIEDYFWDLAKKTYMEQNLAHGKEDDPEFEQKVKDYIVGLAQQATGDESITTYEHAIAEVLSADDAITGGDGERSEILDTLLQQYAVTSHKGEGQVEGLSKRRYNHVSSNLNSKFYKSLLKEKGDHIIKETGHFKDAKFDTSATNKQIKHTIEDLLNNGEKADMRKIYINTPSYAPTKYLDKAA